MGMDAAERLPLLPRYIVSDVDRDDRPAGRAYRGHNQPDRAAFHLLHCEICSGAHVETRHDTRNTEAIARKRAKAAHQG
jgi:hypothetical protein